MGLYDLSPVFLFFGRAPSLRYGSPPYGVRFAPCFAPLRALQAAHALIYKMIDQKYFTQSTQRNFMQSTQKISVGGLQAVNAFFVFFCQLTLLTADISHVNLRIWD